MNDFEVLQVGGKYPPLAGAKECVAITMGENGITIVYNFNRPTEKEIAGMQANQPFEIRYVVLNDVLYILTKCVQTTGRMHRTPLTCRLRANCRVQRMKQRGTR